MHENTKAALRRAAAFINLTRLPGTVNAEASSTGLASIAVHLHNIDDIVRFEDAIKAYGPEWEVLSNGTSAVAQLEPGLEVVALWGSVEMDTEADVALRSLGVIRGLAVVSG